jgi:hypothetical protein
MDIFVYQMVVQEKILPLYENLKKNPLVISDEMLKKLNIPTNKGGGENLYKQK